MFTGIIKDLGTLRKQDRRGGIYRITVACGDIFKDAGIGDSISVNGVCLTVVEKEKNILQFDVMEETVRRAGLADLKDGDSVNLEDSLKPDMPISGHFVQGHIDCVGRVKDIKKTTGECMMEIVFPRRFEHLVVDKGSVAIDGVSLTVGDVKEDSFVVYIIPHTLKITNLGSKRPGESVNIEFDIIGKYVARLNDVRKGSVVTEDFLKEKGF